MVKKTLCASLVLLSLVLWGRASTCLADLAGDFKQADEYEQTGNYEQAAAIYQAITDDHPGTGDALEAQKRLTILYIAWDKQVQADAAYQELLAKYSEQEHLAKAVDHVADAYREARKYKKARQLYQHVVANWPEAGHAVESQRGVALANILLGDDVRGEAAIEEMVNRFGQHENIARALDHLADDLRELGRYKRAREFYKYVVDHWPQGKDAVGAQGGVARSSIMLGDEAGAHEAIDKLLTDYAASPRLPKVLYQIAQKYEKAKKFDEAKTVYQRIVRQHPQT